MSSLAKETVESVHHWTDTLFSFKTTRDPGFRFQNGQFTMIGLEVEGRPLLRAYSMASANYEDHLEFLSIKVPNGPLTSRLQRIKPGDTLLVSKRSVGTLVIDSLLPGQHLYMLSTGTGLAPFLALVKEPEIYERFEKVVLTHTCRRVDELAYRDLVMHDLPRNEFFGELVKQKLVYYPTVTREAFHTMGRITDLIRNEKLFADVGLPVMDPARDRFMLCGSPDMLHELKSLLESRGFKEGVPGEPGHFVLEKAFVEK
jgi:ferredoxin--NADP+ reductase